MKGRLRDVVEAKEYLRYRVCKPALAQQPVTTLGTGSFQADMLGQLIGHPYTNKHLLLQNGSFRN